MTVSVQKPTDILWWLIPVTVVCGPLDSGPQPFMVRVCLLPVVSEPESRRRIFSRDLSQNLWVSSVSAIVGSLKFSAFSAFVPRVRILHMARS